MFSSFGGWYVTFTAEQVAARIVDIIARRRRGTVSIPAWAGPLAAVQSLAPGLYRGVAARAARRYRGEARPEGIKEDRPG